jgi:serine protease AprX
LNKLKAEFQTQFELDERKVSDYLLANPNVKRIEERNGSTFYIKSIDERGKPIYINTKSNIASGELIKANSLYGGGSIGANITGTNMVAGVWDGGQVRATHELLQGQVTMQAGQTINTTAGNNHMTHVSGTMVGKDIGNSARGIAHNATARCYDWDNDATEMAAFAGGGFLVSNHSYGLGNDVNQAQWTFGAYNDTAQQWDALLKNTPNYLPFVAGGNEQAANGSGKNGALQGYDVITGSSASKNVVTVGAVNADRSMSNYSNYGPTDDGRIKPDICARGTGINSAQYTSDTAYSGDGDDSSGTSYAAPAAAAGALLLQQYYFSLNNSYMSASMLKALLLHAADDEGAAGPDAKFGWGIVNIERAAQIIKDAKTTGRARMYTFTTNPTNNATDELQITGTGTTSLTPGIAGGAAGLKASICWTDDEGPEQTDANGVDPTVSRLVYNFDMEFSRQMPLAQARPYRQLTIADPTAALTLGDDWWQNNADNYRETFIAADQNAVAGESYTLKLRKSAASPMAARSVSVVITGLASSTAFTNPNPNPILTAVRASQCGLILPHNNASVVINGRPVAGATSYDFEVTVDGTAPQNIVNPTASFNFGQLNALPGFSRIISIRVRATVNGVQQPYGTSCNVFTRTQITRIRTSQCGLTVPANNPSVVINCNALAGATSYDFEVVVDGGMAQIVNSANPLFNFGQLAVLPGMNATLVIRARATVNTIVADWSNPCTVSTPVINPEDEDFTAFSTNDKTIAYPNPFSNQFTLRLVNNSEATLKIYDINGRLLSNETINDRHEIEMGQNLPSGIYMLRVEQNNEVLNFKIIKK